MGWLNQISVCVCVGARVRVGNVCSDYRPSRLELHLTPRSDISAGKNSGMFSALNFFRFRNSPGRF